MFARERHIIVLLLLVWAATATADSVDGNTFAYPDRFGLGTPVAAERWPALLTAIPPDGEGLPDGAGTYAEGQRLFRDKCESCHGADLAGTPAGRPLIGGRGSLTTERPLKTVESYWPSAPAVFSYIRNAMPTTAPGSLGNADVYALLAYILGSADIVSRDLVLDRDSLPEVRMPNRDGFVPDPRPDVAVP